MGNRQKTNKDAGFCGFTRKMKKESFGVRLRVPVKVPPAQYFFEKAAGTLLVSFLFRGLRREPRDAGHKL